MPRPGVDILVTARRALSGTLFATDTAFFVGQTERGPTDEDIIVNNLGEFELWFGGRVPYSVLWDAVDTAFREGVSRMGIRRVVGPAASFAGAVHLGAADADAITVRPVGPGAVTDWTSQIIAGDEVGTYRIRIAIDGSVVAESYDLASNTEAVEWASGTAYVRVVVDGATLPTTGGAAVPISGGTDDRANITDTERVAAIQSVAKAKGIGQLAYPGATTSAVHVALLEHAKATNRWALLDGVDSASEASQEAAAAGARTGVTEELAETYGMYWADWFEVPGLVRRTTRVVPPSAVVAGVIARSDQASQNPNLAAAGDNGVCRYALRTTQPGWTDEVREQLMHAGVNTAKVVETERGPVLELYGFRSLADPNDLDSSRWVQASHGRLRMAIWRQADIRGERYVFAQIDGRRQKISQFQGDLTADLIEWYDKNALFGESTDEAFAVDTGPTVNTDDSIADGQLRANIAIRPSPFAEHVVIEYVFVPANDSIAA